MDIKLAANYASGLVINQICFGKFRDRKSGDLTGYEIVSCIAESFGLIPPGEIEKVNKRFTKKSADEK